MLKYLNTEVTFAEIPDEVTLCINITGCTNHCKGCHSQFLWEDTGIPLDEDALVSLMLDNKGVSCVCFMGGDQDPAYINWLAQLIRGMWTDESDKGSWVDVKIAWYSGASTISPEINLENFDYIKIGPYMEERGGLDNPKTNQMLLRIDHLDGHIYKVDITSKFWKYE